MSFLIFLITLYLGLSRMVVVETVWLIRVGVVTLFALVGTTSLGVWLISIARGKNRERVLDSDDADGLGVVNDPSSPVAIHSSADSILWRAVRAQRYPANRLAKDQNRNEVQFKIVGAEDPDSSHGNEPVNRSAQLPESTPKSFKSKGLSIKSEELNPIHDVN